MNNDTLPLGLETFAQGATFYTDFYSDDNLSRIVIDVYLADEVDPISTIVDTGAPWYVLDPLLIETVKDRVSPVRRIKRPLNIRGIHYRGWLYDVPIRLEATLGDSMDNVEAVAFVPNLMPEETWNYPNFIGLDGFLNRIRFAVDPASNLFFFGELR